MSADESWRRAATELRQCASSGGRERLGGFSIEGIRLLERALSNGASLRFVLAAQSLRELTAASREGALLERLAGESNVRLEFAPDEIIDELVAGRSFGPILGLVDFCEPKTLAECLADSSSLDGPAAVLAILDAEDPGNVGALVRTALASGARALVAAGCSDPYHPKAVRTSMGAIFRLPILRFPCVDELLAELRSHGLTTAGAVARGGTPLPQLRVPPGPLAVLFGSEAFGLPDHVTEALDLRLTIPMPAGVDSFSLNAAAAVVLYELITRERAKGDTKEP